MERVVIIILKATPSRSRIARTPAIGAPLLGWGVARCDWWVITLAAALIVFFEGAEAAMRWSEVLDGRRAARSLPASQAAPPTA
jgi:hypothetical protein